MNKTQNLNLVTPVCEASTTPDGRDVIVVRFTASDGSFTEYTVAEFDRLSPTWADAQARHITLYDAPEPIQAKYIPVWLEWAKDKIERNNKLYHYVKEH